MIVKMAILRLLGSSDDKKKEKIGVARPEGPPLRGFRYPVSERGSRGRLNFPLFHNHVPLSLRPVSNIILTSLLLTSLTEVVTLYLTGDRKSPVFYQVYLA